MIIYGTQYYRPPFPPGQTWKDDLLKIKASHFNTIKLWAVWSWIERKEGEYYFEDLDQIIALCTEIGLQVVVNTIPEGMPYWFSARHKDAKYLDHEGLAVEMSGAANMPSGGSPGVCPDTPLVQARICDFIRRVVARYAKHDAVIAFDVWNEPHIEPIFDYPEHLFCYCQHSQERFIRWLQKQYGSIEALNRAWLRAYTDWENVHPPVRYGTYPDMIDWRLFWLENLGTWLDARVQAARQAAGGKSIMTHVPFSGYIGGAGEGGLGYHLGDEFLLAPKVDTFGLTSFPKWLMGNDFVQHLTNLEMVASSAAGKVFWQSELQAGAGKWEAMGRSTAKPDEIRLWNWSAVACGAKGVMYWQWKPEPSGMEALGFGLTHLDGALSERTETAGICSQAFNQPAEFDRAQRVQPVNGIFISRTADLWWHAAYRGERLYAKSLGGAYRACFDAGIPVGMVHADRLHEAVQDGLQVLYLPAAMALSNDELEALQAFVWRGGRLVAEACPGLFDAHGVIREDTAFLEDVFGTIGQEIDHQDRVRVQYPPGEEPMGGPGAFSGRYYRQDFRSLQPGVTILYQFEDGRPAAFSNTCGAGEAVLIGTFPALAVALDDDIGSSQMITRWMDPSGYGDLSRISIGEKTLVRYHKFERYAYLCAVNYTQAVQEVQVEFKHAFRKIEYEDETCTVQKENSLKFQVPARDGTLLWLEET